MLRLLVELRLGVKAFVEPPFGTVAKGMQRGQARLAVFAVVHVLVVCATVPDAGVAGMPLSAASMLVQRQLSDTVACSDAMCSGHGRCNDNWCECDEHWAGEKCDYFIKESVDALLSGQHNSSQDDGCIDWCSGHGHCEAGLCRCSAGWTGVDCVVEERCQDECNSPSGVCVDGQCVCEQGFGGSTCAERVCTHGCWGHGTCITGRCACNDGWEGEECDMEIPQDGIAVVSSHQPPAIMDAAEMKQLILNASDGQLDQAHWTSQHVQAPVALLDRREPPTALDEMDQEQMYPEAGYVDPAIQGHVIIAQKQQDQGLPSEISAAHSNETATVGVVAQLDSMPPMPLPHEAVTPIVQPSHQRWQSSPFASADHLSGPSAEAARIGTEGSPWFPPPGQLESPQSSIAEPGQMMDAMRQLHSAMGTAQQTLDTAASIEERGFHSRTAQDTPARAAVVASNDDAVAVLQPALPQISPMKKTQTVTGHGAAHSGRISTLTSATSSVNAPSQCIEDCSGHGTCASGVCQCGGGWTGEACDIQPCPFNCNDRGTCLMGTCACAPEFYGEACESDRCPGDCSGHGFCSNGKCLCEKGFSGAACQPITMPPALASTAGVVEAGPAGLGAAISGFQGLKSAPCPGDCSGNGRCQGGRCTCFGGYVGDSCSDYCPNQCSGRGQCTGGVCLCLSGFEGEDCSLQTCCNGHGACDLPGICVCQPGWMGDECEAQMSCPDPSCSSHGTCQQGRCECDAGYGGIICAEPPAECGICPSEANCDRASGLCMCGGSPCPGSKPLSLIAPSLRGGFSKPSDAMLVGLSGGAAGADGWQRASSGVGGGVVQLISGRSAHLVPASRCNSPHGKYEEDLGACVCTKPYYGKDCENMHCADWKEDSGLPDCTGNGNCVMGECICAAGFGLAPGKEGPNVCADVTCAVDCGAHGMCRDNQCVCQEGWQGPACRLPKCVNDCSGHGSCNFLSAYSLGECVCDYGYALPDCARPALYTKIAECPNECSGNGLCFMGKCTCTSGFSGIDCSRASCPEGQSGPNCEFSACPRECDGKGLCFGGQCTCQEGHMGMDCSLPVQCYEACGEHCLVDLHSEKCEFCKGQCLTLAGSVLGRHDPLAESMSSLELSHKPIPTSHQTRLNNFASGSTHSRTHPGSVPGESFGHKWSKSTNDWHQGVTHDRRPSIALQQLGHITLWGHAVQLEKPAEHDSHKHSSGRGSNDSAHLVYNITEHHHHESETTAQARRSVQDSSVRIKTASLVKSSESSKKHSERQGVKSGVVVAGQKPSFVSVHAKHGDARLYSMPKGSASDTLVMERAAAPNAVLAVTAPSRAPQRHPAELSASEGTAKRAPVASSVPQHHPAEQSAFEGNAQGAPVSKTLNDGQHKRRRPIRHRHHVEVSVMRLDRKARTE